jgi:uncharacterized protein (DUF58 family)
MKKREKIYIIPTEYGLMYGAGIMVSLLGGAMYNNNLAFLLCFFLLALFLIGMVQTHNNVKKISIEKISLFLSPSEGIGNGVVWLKSDNSEGHEQIRIQSRQGGDIIDTHISQVYKKSLYPHYFSFNTANWGKKKLRKIKMSTRYPFGFFYAWRVFKLDVDYYIYPQPSGILPLQVGDSNGAHKTVDYNKLGDDFSEHKRYEVGDSQKHIDWKAYARGRPLLTKKFNEGDRHVYEIDMDRTPGNVERKARQVSQWIHQCEDTRQSYSFRYQNKVIPASLGKTHKINCLRLVASLREVE